MCKDNDSDDDDIKDNYDETCIICGCPLANDDEIGRGCINGACPTNMKGIIDYTDEKI